MLLQLRGPSLFINLISPCGHTDQVVIMGDTCNSDMMASIAMDADVIIHEATNAWIKDQVPSSPPPFYVSLDLLRLNMSSPLSLIVQMLSALVAHL